MIVAERGEIAGGVSATVSHFNTVMDMKYPLRRMASAAHTSMFVTPSDVAADNLHPQVVVISDAGFER
jgi:hypothetical protein